MIRKSITLQNKFNEDLLLDLRYDEGTRDAPTIIIAHGFKGFKDWGFFPDLCRRLNDSGYASICFNFSRNGIGKDPHNFTELDKFAENTCSHELADLEVILKAIKTESIGKRIINPEQLGLLGHSRGGAIASITAQRHPNDFLALVTWSSIANLFRYSEEQIKAWGENGYIEVENSRTKQIMRLNKSFWDDLTKNQTKFDLLKIIGKVEIPSLFIHGAEDTSVPVTESETLHQHSGAYLKRLEIIEEANHTFGIRHPFDTPTPEYETACYLTEHWFDSNLLI